jgi:serine/threonine protein kinase
MCVVDLQLTATTNLAATVVGTPYYLSPELCKGVPYDYSCDIWSLGCILVELLTLKHAFEGFNLPMIVMNIVQGKREPMPADVDASCSDEVKKLIDRMLHPDAALRPTATDVLKTHHFLPALAKLDLRLQEVILQLKWHRWQIVPLMFLRNSLNDAKCSLYDAKCSLEVP